METLSRLVLTFALNAVWQVTLVAAVAAACARLLRRAPARYLHVVWVTALALGALLPLSSLPACWDSAGQPVRLAVVVENPQLPPAPIPARVVPVPLAPAREQVRLGRFLPEDLFRHRSRPIQLPSLLAYAALGFYLLSLLCHLTRLAMAWGKTLHLRRAAHLRDLPGGIALLVAQCRSALGLENVTILCSSLSPGPAAMGFRRPVIILPEALFQASPSEELSAALCHEMAHIRRHDYLLNLICEFVFLPVAFHPAAWLVKRRIDETRELACDEAAAGQPAGASAYARSLLSLARAMSSLASLARPRYTLGVFDADILEERIMRLLEQRPRLRARRAKLLMVGAALALTLVGLGACAFSFTAQENPKALEAAAAFADFSGRWELDKAKSDLPSPAPDNLVQVIEQRGSALKVTSTSKDWNINKPIAVTLFAMMIPELSITTDNRESVQPYGPGQMRSKSRWEGGKLITEWTLERDGQVMTTGEWVRSLSNDGKTQTVHITAHDPNRNMDGEAKAVFVKTGDSVARGLLGTWRGEFQGKTFLIVTLEKAGETLGGTVSIGGFSIDDHGQVKQVNSEPNAREGIEDAPILGATWDGSLLSFRAEAGVPAADLHFQMRLTGDSAAELRGLGPPPLPGQSTPEWSGWWKLSRQPDGSNKVFFGPTPIPEGVPADYARAFLGTWRGEFQSKPYLTLVLKQEGGKIVGSLSPFNVSFDITSGNLVEAGPGTGAGFTITGANLDGSDLLLIAKEGDSGEVSVFKMHSVENQVAELSALNMPIAAGAAAPRPLRLRLVSDATVGSAPQRGVAGGVKGGISGGVAVVTGGIIGGVPTREEKNTVDLSGTVSDPSGARVPNALVTLYGKSGSKKTALTNDAGEFSFTALAPGDYEWKVFRDGFEVTQQKLTVSNGALKSQEGKPDVLVLAMPSPRLEIVLAPSSPVLTMVVTAKAPPKVVEKRLATAPKRIRVGGQVEESKVLIRVPPVYPESAQAKGVEGTVLLEAVISMEGVPLSLRVLDSPDSALSDAAMAAVRQWRYQPTLLNGQPIEVVTTIAIVFRLEG